MSESVNIEKIGLTKDELLRINLTLFREQTKLTLCLESAKKEDVESDWGTELKEQLEQIIGIQKKIHTILAEKEADVG